MGDGKVLKSAQEQAVAAWIDFRNILRLQALAEKMEELKFIYGDVNHDGEINNQDYSLLQRYLNDWDVVFGPVVE